MADNTKTVEVVKEYTPPAMVVEPVFIEGVVRFANPQSEGKMFGEYGVTLVLEKTDPQILKVKELHKQGTDAELARLPEHKRDETNVKKAPLKHDTLDDKVTATGLIRVSASSKAATKSGKPMPVPFVVDVNGNPLVRPYIQQGSRVKMQVAVESYVNKGDTNIKLRLQGVKILEEVPYEEREIPPFKDYFASEDGAEVQSAPVAAVVQNVVPDDLDI